MATHDYNIANGTGAAVRADINNVLAAIQSTNANSSAPSTTVAFQLWADTSSGTLKIRNAANSAFIELFQLDGTFTLEDGSASSPALGFRDDLNTGIFSGGADEFNIATGGIERFVINSSGNCGIGTVSPTDKLHVVGDVEFELGSNLFDVMSTGSGSKHTLRLLNADASAGNKVGIQFGPANNVVGASIEGIAESDFTSSANRDGALSFTTRLNGTLSEAMRINSSGNVGINESASNMSNGKLTIKIDTNKHIGFSGTQGEVNNVPALVAYQDNGSLKEMGFRGVDLRFATGSAERMRLDDAGKLGIGTTSPQAKLQVNDTNPVVAEFYHSDGGTNDESRIALGALSSNIPSQRGILLTAVNNGAGHDFSIRTSSSHSLGPSEKMKVTSDGTIFLSSNTSTTGGGSSTLYVAGSQMQIFRGNQGDYIVFKTTSNSIVGTIRNDGNTSTQYNTSSDYRLKEKQTAISDGITRLKTLKPYRFNWKSDSSRIVDGFFAHEVTAVPEAVSGTKDAIAVQEDVDEGRATNVGDPVYQSIDHSKLVPLLTAALQEEISKRESLEARVVALEAA